MTGAEILLRSRRGLPTVDPGESDERQEAEGGCGVVGLASSVPVRGEHILCPVEQMHNRGNGKGGGIAAVGLLASEMGVPQATLDSDYLLQVAYLDGDALPEVEAQYIDPKFVVHERQEVPHLEDWESLGLDVKPPAVWRYFVRVRREVLDAFVRDQGLEALKRGQAEDEFVFQNTYRLNTAFYASLGEKRAFVLSHGRNMFVFKVVGFAEQAARYYRLEDVHAHVWIGHQRYPTKGRVWHPGGAHPFIGLDDALVHNGDFANYHSVVEYLKQRNIHPLFLTDTEVSALLFDLLRRVYGYPLEYVIEAMAPTTERDFTELPADRQRVYRMLQATHIHGSPDGPWFFIIGRNDIADAAYQLIGITDTSMLRPQVFALQVNDEASIGLIASEKQAIDATLESLAREDPRFCPVADRYWNARGGSHTDGGAFVFSVHRENGHPRLACANKFGDPVEVRAATDGAFVGTVPEGLEAAWQETMGLPSAREIEGSFEPVAAMARHLRWDQIDDVIARTVDEGARDDARFEASLGLLTKMLDRMFDLGGKRRAVLRAKLQAAIYTLLRSVASRPVEAFRFLDWDSRGDIGVPNYTTELVVDARGFPPEGEESLHRLIVDAYHLGWRRFIVFDCTGQRFIADGLGSNTQGVRIDVYGSPGDYLASGLDGAEVHVHANGQDQLAQILKAGKLVVHGDVGQTFMYAAKGGEVYVRGNAAGRPLINAVGRPRVVINGTCLDYLAESFMAGDPLRGGGFVVLNGIRFREDGTIEDLGTPYPGGNLFSLASGGAIYIRDPKRRVGPDQLNGGMFDQLSDEDWELIRPYLEENERLFGIKIDDLLRADGVRYRPHVVYRKVKAVALKVLAHTGL